MAQKMVALEAENAALKKTIEAQNKKLETIIALLTKMDAASTSPNPPSTHAPNDLFSMNMPPVDKKV